MQIPHTSPVIDANSSAGGALGDLPEWDLSDLYAGEDAPELSRDMKWLKQTCADFAETYAGKLADLDAKGMLACIDAYEQIDLIAGRIMSFAGLRYYQNTVDSGRAQFLQNCQEQITDMTGALVFFSLEINRLEDEALAAMFAENADLARFEPVLTACVR